MPTIQESRMDKMKSTTEAGTTPHQDIRVVV
jgi:hypothetical protein